MTDYLGLVFSLISLLFHDDTYIVLICGEREECETDSLAFSLDHQCDTMDSILTVANRT